MRDVVTENWLKASTHAPLLTVHRGAASRGQFGEKTGSKGQFGAKTSSRGQPRRDFSRFWPTAVRSIAIWPAPVRSMHQNPAPVRSMHQNPATVRSIALSPQNWPLGARRRQPPRHSRLGAPLRTQDPPYPMANYRSGRPGKALPTGEVPRNRVLDRAAGLRGLARACRHLRRKPKRIRWQLPRCAAPQRPPKHSKHPTEHFTRCDHGGLQLVW
jgi:hypothetical protein